MTIKKWCVTGLVGLVVFYLVDIHHACSGTKKNIIIHNTLCQKNVLQVRSQGSAHCATEIVWTEPGLGHCAMLGGCALNKCFEQVQQGVLWTSASALNTARGHMRCFRYCTGFVLFAVSKWQFDQPLPPSAWHFSTGRNISLSVNKNLTPPHRGILAPGEHILLSVMTRKFGYCTSRGHLAVSKSQEALVTARGGTTCCQETQCRCRLF